MLSLETERTRSACLVRRPLAVGEQQAMGDPNCRQIEDGAEVEGQAGAARMVPARCVDEQDIRLPGKSPHRRLQQRPLAEREQARLVRGARLACDEGTCDKLATPHDSRARPAGIARLTGAALAVREADEAAGDREVAGRPQRRRGRARQLLLLPDQLLHSHRPRAHEERIAALP